MIAEQFHIALRSRLGNLKIISMIENSDVCKIVGGKDALIVAIEASRSNRIIIGIANIVCQLPMRFDYLSVALSNNMAYHILVNLLILYRDRKIPVTISHIDCILPRYPNILEYISFDRTLLLHMIEGRVANQILVPILERSQLDIDLVKICLQNGYESIMKFVPYSKTLTIDVIKYVHDPCVLVEYIDRFPHINRVPESIDLETIEWCVVYNNIDAINVLLSRDVNPMILFQLAITYRNIRITDMLLTGTLKDNKRVFGIAVLIILSKVPYRVTDWDMDILKNIVSHMTSFPWYSDRRINEIANLLYPRENAFTNNWLHTSLSLRRTK